MADASESGHIRRGYAISTGSPVALSDRIQRDGLHVLLYGSVPSLGELPGTTRALPGSQTVLWHVPPGRGARPCGRTRDPEIEKLQVAVAEQTRRVHLPWLR